MILTAQSPGVLDQPLNRWFPKCPEDKKGITPKHLLAHSSGLPGWRPYYLYTSSDLPRSAFTTTKILAEPLEHPPGTASVYSDLGFMLLAFILEHETGHTVESFAKSRIFDPLGLADDLMFNPYGQERRTALTRKREPAGLVNDLNARTLGGAAGHAGLFGTASAAGRIAAEILSSLKSEDGFFSRAVTRLFCRKVPGGQQSSRALGFDTPSVEGSSCGRLFSSNSLGHTGFTGTSVWIDLVQDLVVVLLTNRVLMGESNFRITAFRPLLHDAVMEEISRF
jgi:CubicO group peptidase (beta-lactamase class C family)